MKHNYVRAKLKRGEPSVGTWLTLPDTIAARLMARVGFDWPDASGPRAKIDEELEEVETATTDEDRAGEIGDLLFAVVNYARHLGIDPEAALAGSTERFESRFRKVEEIVDKPLKDMDIDALEALWQRAKKLV